MRAYPAPYPFAISQQQGEDAHQLSILKVAMPLLKRHFRRFMMCGCGSTPVSLPLVSISELTQYATQMAALNNRFNRATLKLGVAGMPGGGMFYYASDEKEFAARVGGFDLVGSFGEIGNEARVKLSAFKGGKDVATIEWVIENDAGAVNQAPYIKVTATVDDKIRPLNAFEDCVKRHAGDCAKLCCLFGCSAKCLIACCVGSAACCLINPHC